MRGAAIAVWGALGLVMALAGCAAPRPAPPPFPWNFGQYLFPPDVVASRPGALPRNMACPSGPLLVYAAHAEWVANCNAAGPLAFPALNPTVQAAAARAATYTQNDVTCANGCDKSVQLIWAGWDCKPDRAAPAGFPFLSIAAVEVQVFCSHAKPELPDPSELAIATSAEPQTK